MDEKKFVDCDGCTGNCKVKSDLIRISSSVYSGDVWVERYINSKKINTIHVQLFNYRIKNRLFETLREISKRNDQNYDSYYCNGNPISLPGIIVGSNSPTEKIFWEDLGKALRMLSNID